MDLTGIIGLVAGFGVIGTAVVMGGAPASFVDVPALLVVVGGTLAVTAITYSPADVMHAHSAVVKTMARPDFSPQMAATQVLQLAGLARRKGTLALEEVQPEIATLPFLHDAIAMVVDGSTSDEIEKVLDRRADAIADRHAKSVGVLRRAGEVSPAMGLIGTLVGLVQMLGNLDDPSTIGPGMAVALLTTFYGAVLSNMVFSPLASRLERDSCEEVLLNAIYRTGATSIGRKENPRRLEMLINTLLSPSHRVRFYD